MHSEFKSASPTSPDSGFSLVVTLLLLVALSLIGVAALRNVSLQEKMAGNFYFRMTAMQDAQGALRQSRNGVEVAFASSTIAVPAGSWTELSLGAAAADFWRQTSSWASADTAAASAGMTAQSVREHQSGKHFSCEDSDSGCKMNYIRMTARTKDGTGSAAIFQDWNVYPAD
jgi:type IV pilus assembly protein PilX